MNFTLFVERLKTKDLWSNESRDHFHEHGYLVPSPRYGFRFEAVFSALRLKFHTFRIPRKCYFRAIFDVWPLIYCQDCPKNVI